MFASGGVLWAGLAVYWKVYKKYIIWLNLLPLFQEYLNVVYRTINSNKKQGGFIIMEKIRVQTIKMCLLLFIFVIAVSGCQNGDQIKGVKERGRYEEEPVINVKMEDGQTEEVKLEKYIAGVVAGEMEADWPENSYAAQAIIARTFALRFLEENETDTISGSFKLAQEYAPEKISDEINTAVEKTRAEVIFHDNDYIRAWFHASAGGQTTTAKVGLAYEEGEPPYTVSVSSPDDMAPEDVQQWSVSFAAGEILSTLRNMGEDINSLEEINIMDKDKTGRAVNLEFVGDGETVQVKAANFRNELDPRKLKSTKITEIENTNNEFRFTGEGYGHGVGMSQWGAYSMAKEGKEPEEIIDHYFDNVEIVKVYE